MNKENKNYINYFDLVILVLSIYTLIILAITSLTKLPKEQIELLDNIDNFVCVIFLIDFLIRFFKSDKKSSFMKWGWIDLISSIPMINCLRIGRIVRVIRLFKILKAFRSAHVLIHFIFKSKIKGTMLYVSLATFIILIVSSLAILSVETLPNCNIKNASDAFWWSMETITTVGYGDKYPITDEGRIIGTLLMCTGVGFFGTFTGFISNLLTDKK
jgi:voltage-gated potassium channel